MLKTEEAVIEWSTVLLPNNSEHPFDDYVSYTIFR